MVRCYNNNGQREVFIMKQEDGDGLHQDKMYQKEMQSLFAERDWLIFNQPSQLPNTNVYDACIFPMMNKAVSTNQAIIYGSRLLRGEQFHNTVMQVWNDKVEAIFQEKEV